MRSLFRQETPQPLYCRWLWNGATVLCDGTVTCGLDDPFKTRSYGNLESATLREILATEAIARRRKALLSGIRCQGCSMYEPAGDRSAAELDPGESMPQRLIVEPSIRCNIRCTNETCNIANDPAISLRTGSLMRWELYCRLIDEVGPHLRELHFYNYGEPFLHPLALDMLAYARRVNPGMRISTSTNGILLVRDGRAERLVAEQLVDFIGFTIGGVDQESYQRYHKAGSFEQAIQGMRRVVDAKRRTGHAAPIVHWRYLLFDWNDSDACIAEALRLQAQIGVDQFRFMLTGSPLEGRSLRRAPGTPGFEAIRPWLAYQEGYAADPYAEAGLWGAEHSQWLGPFSWTGARARILVTPQRGGIRLRLSRGATDRGRVPRVTLRLPWGSIAAQCGTRYWRDTVIPVPSDQVAGPVPVEIAVDPLFVPMRHGIPGDSRELGVKVSLVGVVPAANPHRVQPAASLRQSGCSQGLPQPAAEAQVRDVGARADLGAYAGGFSATVPPHDASFLRVTQVAVQK